MVLGNIGAKSSPHIWLDKGWSHLRDYAHSAMTHFRPSESEAAEAGESSSSWGILAVDVLEHKEDVEIRFEVPGMNRDDLVVEFVRDQLVVRGEKHMSRSRKDGNHFITERAFGHFERTIPMPSSVDAENASASYADGVLTVMVPKNETKRPATVPIS